MTIEELLAATRAAGIRLRAERGRLLYEAPAGALTPELKAALTHRRVEVLASLDPNGPFPLTAAQQSLWFLDQLHPGDTSASEQFVLRLEGLLDEAALSSAWAGLLDRHAILRATFRADGEGVGQRWGAATALPATQPLREDMAAWREVAEQALARPFDLGAGPLLRPQLFRCRPDLHLLVVTAHHIVADGLSVPLIRETLADLYARAVEGGVPVPGLVEYDYAAYARAGGSRPAREAVALEHWRSCLARLPPPPLAALVPTATGSRRSRRLNLDVPAPLADGLRRLAQAESATPFMVLSCAFRLLVARLTGEDDLVIGTPMTLRDRPEWRTLVGCMVNPVALRHRIDPAAGFRALLRRERQVVLEALEHREAAFSRVVEAVSPPRELHRHPLFQILFSYEPEPASSVHAAGVEFRLIQVPADRASYFDLECSLRDGGEGTPLRGHLGWSTQVLDDWVAERLPGTFLALLADLVARPEVPVSRLNLLPPEERVRMLGTWNDTAAPADDGLTLHQCFLDQARRTPHAPALRTTDGVRTYGELAARSESLARQLLARGAVPGDRVGIALPRSPELVLAVLAALRAGLTVVPLDPGFPDQRLRLMAADADLALLLVPAAASSGQLAARLGVTAGLEVPVVWDGAPAPSVPLPVVAGDAPALILYTSGSTGQPKGAITLHHAAVHRCQWMWREHDFGVDDVFALRTTLNFIDALWEIFGALGHGVTLAIVPDEVASDALRLPAMLKHLGVTHLVLVPSLLRAVLEAVESDPHRRPPLRSCISSGEPLEPELVRRFRRSFPGARLLNTWGTSEIWDATCYDTAELPEEAARVPIGRPIANARVYVLDRQGEPLPVGIPGELWVGGLGVGPGYWRNPGLTAEKFVAAPGALGPEAGRLYRSGDRVRFLANGTLECLGRLDDQRKLRGMRFEPGEVEAALADHPAVRAAIVGLAGEGLEARLRAGVVLKDPPMVEERKLVFALRTYLAERLPSHLVPAGFVVLDTLPLTPSGKRDRRRFIHEASGRLLEGNGTTAAAAVPPRTPTEQRLAKLWCEVLQREAVGVHDDFFALGGHSLLAVRLTTRIRGRFGTELALRDFFAAPTIAGLAALLDGPVPGAREAIPALVPVGRDGPLPLSFGQERLWLLDQLDPASPAYNVAWTVRLTGELDPSTLVQALEYLVARHEPLRACFPAVAGSPTQVIAAQLTLALETEDLENVDEPDRQAWLVAFARRPFDLGRGPLLRAALLKFGPRTHGLALVIHHAVTDATSNHILFEELAAAYDAFACGLPPALPPLIIQYADYAYWQRRALTDAHLATELAWWREALAGAPPALELPTDRPRPAEQRFAGAWVRRRLSPSRAEQLRQLARARQGTLFDLLLAAFQVLLHRVSGATDILVGTPVEGRLAAPVEHLVGLFINTLVMRGDLRGDPDFLELLARTKVLARAAQAHQSLPFERLVEALAPERSLSRSPVFQVMFNLIRLPERHRRAGNLEFHLDRLVDLGVASFDLTLTAGEHADGLDLIFEYATDLFDASTMEGLASGYMNLLDAIVADPKRPISRLSLLDAQLRAALVAEGNPRTLMVGGALVHEVIAGVAARAPRQAAVTLDETTLCYGELEAWANQLAHYLLQQGAVPGNRVGLCLTRSPEYLVALLACLKAGCAYVPLDPEYPAPRLEAMARDADLAVLLVSGEAGAALRGLAPRCVDLAADAARIAACPDQGPVIPVSAGDLAYVLYTSGTTGTPKGVMVTHGNLASQQQAWQAAYALESGEVHLQMANAAFDVFTGDVVRALCSGGQLVICPRESLLDPPAVLALLRDRQVRVAEFVPAVIRCLLDHLEHAGLALPALRLLVVGSDTWHAGDLARLRRVCATGTRIINSYGVAEATIDSAWYDATLLSRARTGSARLVASAPRTPTRPGHCAAGVAEVDPDGMHTVSVPIGRPFANTCIYLLDPHGEPVLPGQPGELCIGGHGVARGYLGQPGLTAQRFLPDPFRPGMRMYRTGDRARRRADGAIELLGRLDHQLKLRGFRIEPGEIEAVLASHPVVDTAVVGLSTPSSGEPRLVAWVVYREQGAAASDLRAWLQGRLPAHLVPAVFLALPALPLTPNGKVDRAALAASATAPDETTGALPGRTPLEELLCGLFAEVLSLPAFGVHEDFFARGGHSLLATRLVARIRAALAVELPLRAVFEMPTPAGVARAIAMEENGVPGLPVPLTRRSATLAALPLSPPQQRLWFLHQLEPQSAAYHLHWSLRLTGALDAEALKAAVNDLVARHEALRTRFVVETGTPCQRVEPRLLLEIPLEEYSEAALYRCLTAPFDLARGPLLRVALFREARDVHVLMVVLHHIVADGWSLAVLGRELSLLYGSRHGGKAAALPGLPVQYGDYALWLAGLLDGGCLDGQLRYWQDQLTGLPPRLPLPRDGNGSGTAGAWLTRTLPSASLAQLHELARAEGATLFMVLLACFDVVLGRYAGTEDVAVGTPVAGRGRTELEGLIGFFVNTLVLRTNLGGNPTFRELVGRVKRMALSAYANAELPFEKLVEVLNPPRSLEHSPLVQVQMVLHNQPRAELRFPGLEVTPVALDNADAKFDLNLHLAETSGGLEMALAWRADLYRRERIEALFDAYVDVLQSVAAEPTARLSSLRLRLDARPDSLRRAPAGLPPEERPRRMGVTRPGTGRLVTDEVEAALQSIWCELLRRDSIGLDDDFFMAGGHSLLATRLIARISERLGVELPLLRVFQTPTVRGLARVVREAPAVIATGPSATPIPRLPRLPRRPGG